MANIARTTAVWTGPPGMPGYSQFYHAAVDDVPATAQAAHNSVNELFDTVVALLPEEVTVTVDPIYSVIDAATGEIVSEGTVGDPTAPTVGTYVGGWSAQVGVLVEWITGAYIAGRRLRGRTYLVPLGQVGDSDGTLSSGTLATLASAAANIVSSAADFVVWHRPKGAVAGSTSFITAAVIRDHAAVLRSRMI